MAANWMMFALKEQSVEWRQIAVEDMSDLVMNQLIRRSQAVYSQS